MRVTYARSANIGGARRVDWPVVRSDLPVTDFSLAWKPGKGPKGLNALLY